MTQEMLQTTSSVQGSASKLSVTPHVLDTHPVEKRESLLPRVPGQLPGTRIGVDDRLQKHRVQQGAFAWSEPRVKSEARTNGASLQI